MEDREKIMTVVSLGVGVQSSTMALMAAKGELPMPDCAIFADTGYEPNHIYEYLEFLKKELPFPIHIVDNGNIKDDMVKAIDNKERYPGPPFFIQDSDTGEKGMLRRYCTADYKILPIRKKIRELCGVGFGKRFPKDKYVEQWIGISTDEIQRMKPNRDKYIENRHPLIEMNMNRQQCLIWMSKNNYPLPQKSACICCPYHDDTTWATMKKERPMEFEEAVWFDKKIRTGLGKLKNKVYLHRSCEPLDEVEFKEKVDNQMDMFDEECEGMCGL